MKAWLSIKKHVDDILTPKVPSPKMREAESLSTLDQAPVKHLSQFQAAPVRWLRVGLEVCREEDRLDDGLGLATMKAEREKMHASNGRRGVLKLRDEA